MPKKVYIINKRKANESKIANIKNCFICRSYRMSLAL